ncbi:MAG TPA: hypothetical protein VMP42_07895 [Actinomycetota bacterium]|nr:hypothetical protein [Actinomycetota bacterium]
MRFSGPSAAAQVLARIWLASAAASLLLPPADRLGWWLPIHLALAGAAGTAVAGTLPLFANTLAGAHHLPQRWDPLLLVTAGAACIAVGRPLGIAWLLAAGGTAYAAGSLRLTWLVLAARLVGRNRRHNAALVAYAGAALSLTLGAVLGGLLGAGAVGGLAVADVRAAHVTLNAEGFLALTVTGSLLVLIPIALRVRAPDAGGRLAVAALAGGAGLQAAGQVAAWPPLVIAGAAAALIGAADLVRVAAAALARRPRMPERGAALHLLAVPAWLIGVTAAALVLAIRGAPAWPLPLVTALTLGVFVQALLGAWSYLLPVSDPGGSPARRARLERTRRWALARAATFNAGVALTVLAAAGWVPGPAGTTGLATAGASALLTVTLASLPAPAVAEAE